MLKKSSPRLPVPDEVIRLILLNLSVKPLQRFKSVCKQWNSWIIDDQDFIEQHLSNQRNKDPQIFLATTCTMCFESAMIISTSNSNNRTDAILHRGLSNDVVANTLLHQYGYIPAVNVLNSSDGIVYFRCDSGQCVFVCNPSTREFRFVPYLRAEFTSRKLEGIGRNEVTKEVKLVRVLTSEWGNLNYQLNCEVLAIGHPADPNKNSWRRLEQVPGFVRGATTNKSPVYLKGAIHWLTHNINLIISFDLNTEKFQAIPYSSCCSSSSYDHSHAIFPWRDSLCFAEQDYYKLKLMNIWINNFLNDDGKAWEKLCSIDLESIIRCEMGFSFVEYNKDELLAIDYHGNKLYVYNPKSKMFTIVRKTWPMFFRMLTTYTESLVPLYGLIKY